ncbi:MAG: hypothetical protein LBQ09_11360, partial [Acidobacteriaceae bacterium]|nr:hypothetical protein [Acidobacteriaceae bacterium]
MTRLLLVGYGKMGRLVGELAPQYGCEVVGIVDAESVEHRVSIDEAAARGVDVAIDFTTPDAVAANVPALAKHGINIVLGTTGWQKDEQVLRAAIEQAGVGIVAAPNFSTGVLLFEA